MRVKHIIISVLFITKESHFPDYYAIAPIIATALLASVEISGGKNLSFNLLVSKPMVKLGLLSFSLHLWHWPVLAFIRYQTADTELSLTAIFAAICIRFSCSFLS